MALPVACRSAVSSVDEVQAKAITTKRKAYYANKIAPTDDMSGEVMVNVTELTVDCRVVMCSGAKKVGSADPFCRKLPRAQPPV